MTPNWTIEALLPADCGWVEDFIRQHWGAAEVIVHGDVYFPAELPGFVCREERQVLGLVTYRFAAGDCEVVSLDSLRESEGIGSALMTAVVAAARGQKCGRVWLITTNDNLTALRFYQKRGFQLLRITPGAVDEARKHKPEIPMLGHAGIPIHDEIEFGLPLD